MKNYQSLRRGLVTLGFLQALTLTSTAGQQNDPGFAIKQARLEFSTRYVNPKRLKEYMQTVVDSGNIHARSELLLLLTSTPLPFDVSATMDQLRAKGFSNQKGERVLAVQTYDASVDRKLFRTLKNRYPEDYAFQARFIFLNLGKEEIEKEVGQALAVLERLTDNHPLSLSLRALFENFVADNDPNYKGRLGKALVYYKLYRSARLQIGDAKRVNEEIKLLEAFLKKKGITPPEPTPEQYAAVKKRGWAFNKQMLEPFKKVD